MTFSSRGDLAVGFVTRESTQLATREKPALILHAITLGVGGNFLSERRFRTTDWYANGLFTGDQGTLLVQTGSALSLYSARGDLISETQIASPQDVRVLSLPHHYAFAVNHLWPPAIEILDSRLLNLLGKCSCSNCRGYQSVSDHNVLMYPSDLPDPFKIHIEVTRICGPLQFSLEWSSNGKGVPSDHGTLVDDDHVVFAGAGSSAVDFFDRGVRRWRDSLDTKHDIVDRNVALSSDGSRLAVAVWRSIGGSEFFDVNGHLKNLRIIVYRSADGEHLADVSVERLPSNTFDFAISPDDTVLAVLEDGDLTLVRLDPP